VQAEAFDYPEEFYEKRVWKIARPRADVEQLQLAAEWIRQSRRAMIIAGGGVHYSDAIEVLARWAAGSGIPVGETQAGKGALRFDHPQCMGAMGVTGTPGANILAREADLIIGIGTRYSDFTTASKTAFQNPDVRFININVAEFDAFKHAALPLVADARVTIDELMAALKDYRVDADYAARISILRKQWDEELERLTAKKAATPPTQGQVIGVVNEFMQPRDVVVCAAGSLPGDLHKMWRTQDSKGYHLEYGYSTMGYEIAGGLGVKMADPAREVYVLVGDGSYLMMAQEIVTSIQEGYKLNIVVLDNHGFSSIGGLSRACGSGGFGTDYRFRKNGKLEGDFIELDIAANAASLGAKAVRVQTNDELINALAAARKADRTSVIVMETDKEQRVPGYESWWDVAISEVSQLDTVRAARKKYEEALGKERHFFRPAKAKSGQKASGHGDD
jgi:3D-(3,5/4)-trihydroxycyclohexane-1,2-dione acylhydrolase (decyclizing)